MPETVLDTRYSGPDATATDWDAAAEKLAAAEIFWLSTVRTDGRPHVTPLISVWVDGALHIGTGPHEQKARNLAKNPLCAMTTGTNAYGEGLDLVVEGEAVRVTEHDRLQRVADAFEAKYGSDWHFDVVDGKFNHAGAEDALVFAIAPVTAYGFGKGIFSHTRWQF
jgi:hypothetical protein